MLETRKEKETQWPENQQPVSPRDDVAVDEHAEAATLTKEKATTGKKLTPAR
jgi:hypothetical protein